MFNTDQADEYEKQEVYDDIQQKVFNLKFEEWCTNQDIFVSFNVYIDGKIIDEIELDINELKNSLIDDLYKETLMHKFLEEEY